MSVSTASPLQQLDIYPAAEKLGIYTVANLKQVLQKRNISNACVKYAQRAAVFSEPFETLPRSEIQVKEIVWHWLDRLYSPLTFSDEEKPRKLPVYWMPLPEIPVRTLFTSVIYGADYAAAEYFVNKKMSNEESNIAYCPADSTCTPSPFIKTFFTSSFSKSIGYSRKNDGSQDDPDAAGKFIVDQCFHLLFLLDSEKENEDLKTNRLFDYAVSAHRGSIPHQIEVIYLNEPLPEMFETIEDAGLNNKLNEAYINDDAEEADETVEKSKQFEQLSLFN